jgi:hypothetical protein
MEDPMSRSKRFFCRTTGCHGSNACRRKGFLHLDKETCLNIEAGA